MCRLSRLNVRGIKIAFAELSKLEFFYTKLSLYLFYFRHCARHVHIFFLFVLFNTPMKPVSVFFFETCFLNEESLTQMLVNLLKIIELGRLKAALRTFL